MIYCHKCLQPDTRPNSKFTADGLCPACSYHNQLNDVDWSERSTYLNSIVKFGKANQSNGYDCIIGVSGGKDSTRQAIFVKEVLGMNPLLVCLAPPPVMATQLGVDNLRNLVAKGFDCIKIEPSVTVWKKLMRYSFFKYQNPFKSTELALFSSVPSFAIRYQIPLIWWGENSALQLGETGIMGTDGADGNSLRNMNTLSGGDYTWLIDAGLNEREIQQYKYPSKEHIERANIKITFLGYFWKDWSMLNNAEFSMLHGLDIRNEKPQNIGEHYGITALDEHYTPFNQMIKYLKYGFGRTTDYVNEDIRNGIITRQEGIKIVEEYDGCCSLKYIKHFCDFVGIDLDKFWEVIEQSALNKRLFEKDGRGLYLRKFKVGTGL